MTNNNDNTELVVDLEKEGALEDWRTLCQAAQILVDNTIGGGHHWTNKEQVVFKPPQPKTKDK